MELIAYLLAILDPMPPPPEPVTPSSPVVVEAVPVPEPVPLEEDDYIYNPIGKRDPFQMPEIYICE